MLSRWDALDEDIVMFRCDICPRVALLRELVPSQRAKVECNPKPGIRCRQCIAERRTRGSSGVP